MEFRVRNTVGGAGAVDDMPAPLPMKILACRQTHFSSKQLPQLEPKGPRVTQYADEYTCGARDVHTRNSWHSFPGLGIFVVV